MDTKGLHMLLILMISKYQMCGGTRSHLETLSTHAQGISFHTDRALVNALLRCH